MHLSKEQFISIIIFAALSGGVFGFLIHPDVQIKEVEVPLILDFEEGAEGDFLLNVERKDSEVVLDWVEPVKVIQVRVYNLKDPRDFTDHQLVFFIANKKFEPSLVKSIIPEYLERFTPQENWGIQEVVQSPEPDVSLISPHQIGKVPANFYNNTPQKVDPIFTKNQRYLIEAYGVAQGELKIARYLFKFK